MEADNGSLQKGDSFRQASKSGFHDSNLVKWFFKLAYRSDPCPTKTLLEWVFDPFTCVEEVESRRLRLRELQKICCNSMILDVQIKVNRSLCKTILNGRMMRMKYGCRFSISILKSSEVWDEMRIWVWECMQILKLAQQLKFSFGFMDLETQTAPTSRSSYFRWALGSVAS